MRYLFRLIFLFVLALWSPRLWAQKLDTSYYGYPLAHVAGYFSANFGEMRSNHFHSGVDFKTDGREGKPVLAVAEGYVQRVLHSPTGYGRALYVVHPNGTTSVYGHLSSFRADIEEWVKEERLKQRSNRLDLWCDSARFRVARGEEIARSGNSGTSFGPHLHFEIRQTASQRTLNTLSEGLFSPKDHIPPYLYRLHYVALDTMRGVAVNSPLKSYEIERRDGGEHRLRQQEPLEVDRLGYFILEGSDRKDDVSNTFGLYHIALYRDQELLFEYRMEGFTFDLTRYCNAVSFYPLQRRSRNEVIRLAALERTPRILYSSLKEGGVIRTSAEESAKLKLIVTDDCGNSSTLHFTIKGIADERSFTPKRDSLSPVVICHKPFSYSADGLRVKMRPGTLYEDTFYHQTLSERKIKQEPTLIRLSPLYRLLSESVPLHRAIELSIDCFVPVALRERVAVARLNDKGGLVMVGGSYMQGRVTAKSSTLGEFCVVADTLPPRITPRFKAEDLPRIKKLRFGLSDNFSGVARWAAYVDGEWFPLDYQPVRAEAILSLEEIERKGAQHRIVVRVEDGCGNRTSWEGIYQF